MVKQILLSFTLFSFLISCSSKLPSDEFKSHLQNQDCDQALFSVPENQKSYQITSVSKEAGGKLISYSFTGAAYAVQILWDSSVVIASAVVLCAPAIALSMSKNNSNLNIQGGCFPGKVSPLMAPKLGENAYDQTQNLRCPEVQDLSRSIRSVAQCYYQKGGIENLKKAISTLESVKSSNFYQCLPASELNNFTTDLYSYKGELSSSSH